ncbi:MAG: PD40 domain-containing protein [Elusimicrobiaceae bacterium]|nr:PD40 domain-containing protein [Elusimicrobiaceae bacterium]
MTKRFVLFLTTVIFLFHAGLAVAAPKTDVYIGITSVGKQKLPTIAMPVFTSADPQSQPAADQVREVMRADLLFARYFDVTQEGPAFDVNKVKDSLKEWGKFSPRPTYILTGTISYAEPYYTIKIYVYDLATRTAVFAKAFKGTQSSLRRLAHIASDQIVSALLGKRGIADTKIAFANNSTRHKEIYVVDYDGQNLQKLTRDNSISLLPRWSRDGRIFYTSYKYRNPDIFAIDLRAGKISPIIIKKGLSLIGGVSPDGKALVFTSTGGANPSIFIYNLETQQKVQITNKSTAVDGSPSYSPDGKYITFVSNRAGNPQIYVMELATGQARPLTKNFNWSDTPQWSPTGEWIVFSGRESAYHPMDIFLVDLTGTQIKRLTSDAGSNEDPTWSPDGRFIAFTTTRNGRRQLYMMDMDGSAPHLLADIQGDSFTPHWSM